MIKISLVFDHRNRTKKGEEGPIEVRVTINRKAHYINTGVRVRRNRLVGNAVRDDANSNNADVLNERLTTIVGLVEKEVNLCLEERRPIDVAAIKQKVWDVAAVDADSDEPTMVEWIRNYVKTANMSASTKKRYGTVCNKLLAYGKLTRWEHLTVDRIYAFDVWLRAQPIPLTKNQEEAGIEPSYIGDSAAYSYHKCLMAAVNKAMTLGVVSANPYDRMKGVFKRGKRDVVEYLTEEQMQKVLALTPVPGSQVAIARDLFIIQMFTGLSYSDTQAFDISQYRKEVIPATKPQGTLTERWVNVGQRIKTGVPYVSQLLPPVVEVLERYGWKVPKMSNQRYNQMLKAIGMCIGIANLHSHMGRHTFATYMLANGAKIENVSKMLGHTTVKQTEQYAKVLAENVRSDFDMIAEKINRL
jgi:integrase